MVRTHPRVKWSNQAANGLISFNPAAGLKSEVKLFKDAFKKIVNKSKLPEPENT